MVNAQVLVSPALVQENEVKAPEVELIDFMDICDQQQALTFEQIRKKKTTLSFSADYVNSIVEDLMKQPRYKGKSFEGLKLNVGNWFKAFIENQVAYKQRITRNSAKSVKQ